MRWHFADLDFTRIDVARVRARDDLFLAVCSASFVESASDTYTRNLVEHFSGDPEIQQWLTDQWEPEELQHGRALKAYIQHAWPLLDWDTAYAGFLAEYGRLCTVAELEPKRGLELAARCIVEMGTTTYYQALGAACDEPVLRDLAARIRTDEVLHFKHFQHYFLRYKQQEALSRRQVAVALLRRLAELRHSDSEVALRHAASWRPVGSAVQCDARQTQAVAMIRDRYPVDLAVRMALAPLCLRRSLQRRIEPALAAFGRRIFLQIRPRTNKISKTTTRPRPPLG